MSVDKPEWLPDEPELSVDECKLLVCGPEVSVEPEKSVEVTDSDCDILLDDAFPSLVNSKMSVDKPELSVGVSV